MVSPINSTSNLVQMVSLTYGNTDPTQGQKPAPPSGPGGPQGPGPDPLGVFDTVDKNKDGSISQSEYEVLTEGILEVTGSQVARSFTDFDQDEDGMLNGLELKSVLDESGFGPPPSQVISAYEANSGSGKTGSDQDPNLLAQLLEYLEKRTGNLDIEV